jgi:pyruvate,water dikinase
LEAYKKKSAAELNELFKAGRLPADTSKQITRFLTKYAGRGLGEIDLGNSRWGEDTNSVFDMLLSYLSIDDPERQPDVIFKHSAAYADQAVAQLCAIVRKSRHGWWRAQRARFFADRTRYLMGVRESPKFFLVRLLYLLRCEYLKSGADLEQAGLIEGANDIFFLKNAELREIASGICRDWKALIAGRKENYTREQKRKQSRASF